jgi:hypothetical protein
MFLEMGLKDAYETWDGFSIVSEVSICKKGEK